MRFCFLIAISTVTITAFGEPPSGNHCHSIKQPITWSSIFQGIDLADIKIDGDAPCQGKAMRIELAQRGIEFVVTPDDGDQPGETTVVKVITFAEQQIAVGTTVAGGPPHRSVREELPHTAPASSWARKRCSG